jgi:hypothetical protein
MEHIESALFDLDQTTIEFNEKQVNNVAKVVYNTAESTVKSSGNFDSNFNKYFPEINDLGESKPGSNPHFVIEFKDGKPTKQFTGWNQDIGILPNRRVMSKYYIDVGDEYNLSDYSLFCKKHSKKTIFKSYNSSKYFYNY